MQFKITGANRALGQIEVAYFDENGEHVTSMCLDIPVENGAFAPNERVDELILAQAPTWGLQRRSEMANATGFEALEARVEYMPGVSPEEIEATRRRIEEAARIEFEARVATVLVKFGVLSANPVALPVSTL